MWRPIDEFPRYAVSDKGQVMNLNSGRTLKERRAGRGYLSVCLGVGNYRYIHRLVAKAFVCNENSEPQVNHIDGNKTNNAASNLEWVSASRNLKHAYETGLLDRTACKNPSSGAKHWRSNRVLQSDEAGRVRIVFGSMREASRETGIDQSSIHGALHGRFKQAGGWRWQFFTNKGVNQ